PPPAPADSGAIAAVCQTLVAALADRRRQGRRLPIHDNLRLNENRWRAIRDGLEGKLIDPDSGHLEPTRERIARLLGELQAHADALGCVHELAHAWTMLEGNGAIRQREVFAEHGIDGLLDHLARATDEQAGVELTAMGRDSQPRAEADLVDSTAIVETLA